MGDGGKGVSRRLPHLGDGRGVSRQHPPHEARREFLLDWFRQLQASLSGARVACGDWERICSPDTMTRNGVCACLMDPPYSQTGAVYAYDSAFVSTDVRAWCIANGGNPRLRIALCGHAGEHESIESHGWTVETWAKGGGYQGADDRERIWFSPACLKPETEKDIFDWNEDNE